MAQLTTGTTRDSRAERVTVGSASAAPGSPMLPSKIGCCFGSLGTGVQGEQLIRPKLSRTLCGWGNDWVRVLFRVLKEEVHEDEYRR